MATFLDLSVLEKLSIIFPFLLVFAVTYGVLKYAKVFGEEKEGIHAIIALSIASILIFSPGAVALVEEMVPWFVIMFLVILMIIMSFMLFGAKEGDFMSALKQGSIITWVIVFSVVILLFSFSNVYGQQLLGGKSEAPSVETEDGSTVETGTSDFSKNLSNTLFHPKILGMILILLVATFTILFLTKVSE